MNEYIYLFTGKNTTGQAFTTDAGTTYSFDLKATGKYLGNQPKPVIFKGRVVTAFTGAASGVRVYLVSSDTASISTADEKFMAVFMSANMVYSATPLLNGVIPTTDIDAIGDCIWAVIPPNIKALRYLAVRVVPANEALATGYFQFSMEDGDCEAGTGNVA